MKYSFLSLIFCFASLSLCAQSADDTQFLEDAAAESLELIDTQSHFVENVDKEAEYSEGELAMNTKIAKNLHYSTKSASENTEATVVVSVIIDESGNAVLTTVEKSSHFKLDNAVNDAVSSLKTWKPAMKDGQAVRSKKMITVNFIY